MADHYQLDELVAAFRVGAAGYFSDGMSCDAFIKSIELVMMGQAVFPLAFLSFAVKANAAAAEKADFCQQQGCDHRGSKRSTGPTTFPA